MSAAALPTRAEAAEAVRRNCDGHPTAIESFIAHHEPHWTHLAPRFREDLEELIAEIEAETEERIRQELEYAEEVRAGI